MGEILLKEDVYWKQRAKQFWLKEGDKNTRFFHGTANARRKIKKLSRLKRNDGSWEENKPAVKQMILDYF